MAETVKVQPNSGDQKAFVPTISSYPATGFEKHGDDRDFFEESLGPDKERDFFEEREKFKGDGAKLS
ncbi:hypothetical protein PR003_g13443 [Phytophthora rubi]|uniref:Uncharacterized protein n=1 Tax=Phytophthora rubi TaxID=129364 RepID=A0A6A4F6M7_9STRA|nr:hypothetical protein PR003_g13443 [Phytophthora rubi]